MRPAAPPSLPLARTGTPLLLLALTLSAGACAPDAPTPAAPVAAPTPRRTTAPSAAAARVGEVVRGRYVVVFRDDVVDAPGLARQLTGSHGGTLRFAYEHALRGFAADLPDAAVTALRNNPQIEFVEPVTLGAAGTLYSPAAVQTSATWGIDRIDQRRRPLGGTYSYTEDGSGVRIYVVDSGIDTFHPDFGGRATNVADFVTPSPPNAVTLGTEGPCPSFSGDAYGPNGHGTHVAGTAGGTRWAWRSRPSFWACACCTATSWARPI
jgi:subtilisin family serine protease